MSTNTAELTLTTSLSLSVNSDLEIRLTYDILLGKVSSRDVINNGTGALSTLEDVLVRELIKYVDEWFVAGGRLPRERHLAMHTQFQRHAPSPERASDLLVYLMSWLVLAS